MKFLKKEQVTTIKHYFLYNNLKKIYKIYLYTGWGNNFNHLEYSFLLQIWTIFVYRSCMAQGGYNIAVVILFIGGEL